MTATVSQARLAHPTSPRHFRGGDQAGAPALVGTTELGRRPAETGSMLGFGWLTLRQAQEALKNGRLDDAQRLLAPPAARGQRGAAALLARLARAYAERGEKQFRMDDVEGAWRDLLQAEALQPAERGAARLREALTRLGVAEV